MRGRHNQSIILVQLDTVGSTREFCKLVSIKRTIHNYKHEVLIVVNSKLGIKYVIQYVKYHSIKITMYTSHEFEGWLYVYNRNVMLLLAIWLNSCPKSVLAFKYLRINYCLLEKISS